MAVLVKDNIGQRYEFTCVQWDLMDDASKAAWTVIENTCGIITSAGSPFASSEFLFTLDGKVSAKTPLQIDPVDGVSTILFKDQPKKTVLAGPVSGADDYPTFRLLQLTDLPAGIGTVTSVAATQPAAGFTITGSPITSAGTFMFALADDLAALEAMTGTGLVSRTGSNTYAQRTITAGTGINITNGDGIGGNPTISNSSPDQTVSLSAGTGITITGTYPNFTIGATGGGGTVTSVAATQPAAGFTITGSPITSAGTFTFALADDLAALEGLTGTGVLVRTGTNTYSLRTLTAGAGINITNGDGVGGNPTIAANTSTFYYQRLKDAGTSFTQRGVLNITDSARIAGTLVDDSANDETKISFDLLFNSVADAFLSLRGGLSVMGRASTTMGNVADIVSTADGQVLRRNGTTLDWGTVTSIGIADYAITNTKIRQGTARSVMGVTGNVTADIADIQGTTDQVLRINTAGTALAFGQIATGGITNSAITYAKIQNVTATSRVLGRISAGAGVVEELTPANLQALLGISGAAGQNAYFGASNAITSSNRWLWDNTNGRATIVGQVAGTGASGAMLNIQPIDMAGNAEFLRMWGNITGDAISLLHNTNTTNVGNSIFQIITQGTASGDPFIQYTIAGTGGKTVSAGVDNSDSQKFKITPNTTRPGGFIDQGIIITQDAVAKIGINKDSPAYTLDVNGTTQSKVFVGLDGAPTVVFDTGAGTGPTNTLLKGGSFSVYFKFTTGTAPAANGIIFTITVPYAHPYTITPVWSAGNANAAADFNKFYNSANTATTFQLKANGTLPASTPYELRFILTSTNSG